MQKIVDAGVDLVKLIDQDQMTEEEVRAVVETAHKSGRPVVAHAHREDEIRIGLKYGVDCFEHTGLATEPGYPEDILQGMRKRNQTLGWCPTIEGLFLSEYTADSFPERLNDPRWQEGLAPDIVRDIRDSLQNIARTSLLPARAPADPDAREQVPAAARVGGHDARRHRLRHPGQLPHRLDVEGARRPGSISA